LPEAKFESLYGYPQSTVPITSADHL